MSDTRKLRKKILATFLSLMVLIAIGAEIETHDPSNIALNAQSTITISEVKDGAPTNQRRSLREQFAMMNSAVLVASRFYAPRHAPITWVR